MVADAEHAMCHATNSQQVCRHTDQTPHHPPTRLYLHSPQDLRNPRLDVGPSWAATTSPSGGKIQRGVSAVSKDDTLAATTSGVVALQHASCNGSRFVPKHAHVVSQRSLSACVACMCVYVYVRAPTNQATTPPSPPTARTVC